MMKKHSMICGLALTLALTLTLPCAAAFTDQAEITHGKAVDALVELNILQGRGNGSFDPSGAVTRAEMAKIAGTILLGGESVFEGAIVEAGAALSDIKGHWANLEIRFCTSEGVVSGRADGKFYPGATVTGLEGAKMMLICLGYLPDAAGLTGADWEKAVQALAQERGLLKDLETLDLTAPLTRDSTAQLVQNTLGANVVTYDYILTQPEGGELTATPSLREVTPATNLRVLYFGG